MSRHLRSSDVEKVVGLLDGWSEKLTWDSLCQACEASLGYAPTRQTLSAKDEVRLAFRAAKERLKNAAETAPSMPPSLLAASQRIERLKAENTRLRMENDTLLEKFVRWQYNAAARGLSEADLENPLPQKDMMRTD